MKTQIGVWFLLLVFLGPPIHAQSLCTDCLNAAREELDKCLENAISQEDKKSCAEKQEARSKSCSDGECMIEQKAIPKEQSPKDQPNLNKLTPEKK